jgi:hypothetical protein
MICPDHPKLFGWSNGEHVACMGERRGEYSVWWGNLMERDHLGDPGVGVRVILRQMFRKCNVGAWAGSSWLRVGTDGGHL